MKSKFLIVSILLTVVLGCQLTSPRQTVTPTLPVESTQQPTTTPVPKSTNTLQADELLQGAPEPVIFRIPAWQALAFNPLTVYQADTSVRSENRQTAGDIEKYTQS